jgi:hypothetical protein
MSLFSDLVRTHQRNIERYSLALTAALPAPEQSFVRERLAEEQRLLADLLGNPHTEPTTVS